MRLRCQLALLIGALLMTGSLACDTASAPPTTGSTTGPTPVVPVTEEPAAPGKAPKAKLDVQ